MKFDFTKGKPAKYKVSIYEPDGCHDELYYHYHKDAKKKLTTLSECAQYEKGTIMSLYDMSRGVRKEYVKI